MQLGKGKKGESFTNLQLFPFFGFTADPSNTHTCTFFFSFLQPRLLSFQRIGWWWPF